MKLLTGCLVLAVVGVTTAADAWPWSRNRKRQLPTAIDYPVVRPKAKNTQKEKRQQHPSKYARPDWGQEWYRTLDVKKPNEGNHFLYLD